MRWWLTNLRLHASDYSLTHDSIGGCRSEPMAQLLGGSPRREYTNISTEPVAEGRSWFGVAAEVGPPDPRKSRSVCFSVAMPTLRRWPDRSRFSGRSGFARYLIVIGRPSFTSERCSFQAHEQSGIQALPPERSVVRRDEGILVRHGVDVDLADLEQSTVRASLRRGSTPGLRRRRASPAGWRGAR